MSVERETGLPDGPLVTWYGDDFTGAAAVMEVMTFAGLPAVLFLDIPDAARLERFNGYRGIGIAGTARSRSPEWMEANLPPVFEAMAGHGAPVRHYKICSTLDSAPHVGSIGKAAELAEPILGGEWHPLLVGAPEIRRYQLFGNLFAGAGDETFRLDRHPTMSRHPITPMHEADVCRHLAEQTSLPMSLVDILALQSEDARPVLETAMREGARIIALDILDSKTLAAAGRLVWECRGDGIFAIGSQGVEYALVEYWRNSGMLPKGETQTATAGRKPVVVVSGSCSPVTGDQIAWASERGFEPIKLKAERAVDSREWEKEINIAAEKALAVLDAGGDPIIYTAQGPDDPATCRFREAIDGSGQSADAVNERLGAGLGKLLGMMRRAANIERGIIAGGDTSSHGASELGIYALTALAPIAPGAGLCRAHSEDEAMEGFEIALKGGQMGGPDYFGRARSGGDDS